MDIKECRTNKGLTQIEAAVKVGVSLSAYILWEKGANKPTPENQKKLDEVLGEGKNEKLL